MSTKLAEIKNEKIDDEQKEKRLVLKKIMGKVYHPKLNNIIWRNLKNN